MALQFFLVVVNGKSKKWMDERKSYQFDVLTYTVGTIITARASRTSTPFPTLLTRAHDVP
jgi:hypothetical protein